MKGKLIILVGISNSGKSTFASKLVQDNPDEYIRVNRDDIRNLLFGYTDETVSTYYQRPDISKLEKQVSRFEDTLIYDGLELGKTVIVDATHLQIKYLERFKYWNVETEVKFFDISLTEAFLRDSERVRKVGIPVMEKQYAQYQGLKKKLEKNPIDFTPVVLDNLREVDEFKPIAYVVDIDGTLAEKNDRNAFDWHKVGEDDAREDVATIIRHLHHRFKSLPLSRHERPKIIIATGRDGVCVEETENWLDKHQIPYDEIYIREKGDMRPDWLVKREMAEDIVKTYTIQGWFDDRLQVTRHLRMLGLSVFNVAHGNF